MKISDQRAMKRGIVFGLVVILIAGTLAIFGATPKKSRAASTKDQSCANTNETFYMVIGNNPPEQQSFVPTQNRLTDVVLKLGGFNFNGDATIRILSGDTPIASKTITFATSEPVTKTFTFATPVTLTPGGTYKIWIDDSATASPLYWYYNSDSNCYPNGSAFWGGSARIPDFDFATYGYTEETPPSDQPGDQGTTGATGATGTSETLGTATSAIAKPLELTAAYSDTAGARGVKLTWKASTTTDIDGYKVFRSEESTKGYTKLADTKKGVLEYLDQNVLAGKTYYYQVRAYKSSSQSYSSNTASAAVPADAPPAKPLDLKVTGSTETSLSVAWKANVETNLAGYTITLYKDKDLVKTAEVKKDQTTYDFTGLTAGTTYKITLVAKNDKDKSSDPAETVGATTLASSKYSWFNVWTIVGGVLILGLAGFLVYRIIKRKKAAKV